MTANSTYWDLSVQNLVNQRRFTTREMRLLISILEGAHRDIVKKLRADLRPTMSRKRLKELLDSINELTAEARQAFRDGSRRFLGDLSIAAHDAEIAAITASIPVVFDAVTVPRPTLRALVTNDPFQGQVMSEWFKQLEREQQGRLRQAIQQGLTQGESVDQMVRRVAGTRAKNFQDGALSITRRDADRIVRTAANHVGNAARSLVMDANEDVMVARRWVSVLDGNTSPICRKMDGRMIPVGKRPLPKNARRVEPEGLRPPAHWHCRSAVVGLIDFEPLVGKRPAVTAKDGSRINFRKLAKEQGTTVSKARKRWIKQHVGQVPADETYGHWLRRQPAEFQDEVLGKTRGALFRRGKVPVDKFVDRRNHELTIQELRERFPAAFKKAGL